MCPRRRPRRSPPRRGEGGYLPVCPFLKRVAKNRYLCGIHAVKPEMCRNYQPWIWGETYFNRCKALKKREEYLWAHILE